jgi:hypothetical protein
MTHGSSLKSILYFMIAVWVLGYTSSHAAILCVDSTEELTSALTTAASNGEDDQIQLVQGTYTGNYVYTSTEAYNLAIEGGYTPGCVTREVDAANTVLDGDETDTVIFLSSDQSVDFTVDGVLLQNGIGQTIFPSGGTEGGGLYASTEGSLTLSNSIVRNCSAANGGGILGNAETQILITNNVISENSGFYGGGVCVWGAVSTTLSDNIIINNTTSSSNSGNGGGVQVSLTSTCTIENNIIANNTANNEVNDASSGSVPLSGGGLFVEDAANAIITNNTIAGNSAAAGGGGMAVSVTGSLTMTNNLIYNNSADDGISAGGGGGVYLYGYDADLMVINNTITDNSADGNGGGLRIGLDQDTAKAEIHNNIIWGNTAGTSSDLYINNNGDGILPASEVILWSNNFNQSLAGFNSVRPITIDASNKDNIDPQFLDAANGAFYLNQNSLLINQGTNGAPSLPVTDKEGNDRILSGIVDLGAYEYKNSAADIAVVPLFDFFDDIAVGTSAIKTFRVYNAGGLLLTIGDVGDIDTLSAPFSISSDGCSDRTLGHADSCAVEIEFAPTASNYYSESFDLPSSDVDQSPVTAMVHGISSSSGGSSGGSGGGSGGTGGGTGGGSSGGTGSGGSSGGSSAGGVSGDGSSCFITALVP